MKTQYRLTPEELAEVMAIQNPQGAPLDKDIFDGITEDDKIGRAKRLEEVSVPISTRFEWWLDRVAKRVGCDPKTIRATDPNDHHAFEALPNAAIRHGEDGSSQTRET